ncbi:MAG: amidohydrolase, partial [Sutterella sp.]
MTEKLDPIALRRTLHTMPELAFQEVRTSQFVADTLEKLGYEVTRNVGNTTGVIGVVKGAEPGPTLMLRADMDALPFEIDGKPCAIHACGHDAHTAMLLAAASELKDVVKRGTLKVLFQPAEETIEGALAMIKAGAIDDVDMIVGAHIRPVQD